ncbi:MAG TPA: hypothetical protein VGC92_09800 [Phenylobacterium sp.]|jgi:hypothetical protein
MRLSTIASFAALAAAGVLLSGCLVASVAGAAVGVAGTAVGVTAKGVGMAAHGVGSAVGAVTGGGKKDEKKPEN